MPNSSKHGNFLSSLRLGLIEWTGRGTILRMGATGVDKDMDDEAWLNLFIQLTGGTNDVSQRNRTNCQMGSDWESSVISYTGVNQMQNQPCKLNGLSSYII